MHSSDQAAPEHHARRAQPHQPVMEAAASKFAEKSPETRRWPAALERFSEHAGLICADLWTWILGISSAIDGEAHLVSTRVWMTSKPVQTDLLESLLSQKRDQVSVSQAGHPTRRQHMVEWTDGQFVQFVYRRLSGIRPPENNNQRPVPGRRGWHRCFSRLDPALCRSHSVGLNLA